MLGVKNFDWLIVGLGNPGPRYEKTRHNIGWMVLDYIAEKFNLEFTHRMYVNSFDMMLHDKSIALIKPNIFMNNSGEPVNRVRERYNINIDKIVVITDEVNYPLGKLHIKSGGSDGGHNGIASVIDKLNTTNFIRLRCGIGNNFMSGDMINYVLSDFDESEKTELSLMIKRAGESVEYLIANGLNKTMQAVNSGSIFDISSNEKL
ncbi:MAG: aminoacyl-tRNA hydrolase [Candidatus Kapaibacterium sp.]|jgi:PTH1 family peptidyl-tRNA hydrolase